MASFNPMVAGSNDLQFYNMNPGALFHVGGNDLDEFPPLL
jgi:hypothetical protein